MPVKRNEVLRRGLAEMETEKGSRVILEKGTRQSLGNSHEDIGPDDIPHFLRMLNINLQDRLERHKQLRQNESAQRRTNLYRTFGDRSREERLRGIFGGGR